MSTRAAFSQALLTEAMNCPPGLTTWNGSDPARRFSVHRNNVLVGLVDALTDTYPVTQALVGEAFFRAMAAIFVRAHPPASPVLAYYGKDFPDFVANFPPAATLAYLADLARLEYLRVEAYHAADASGLSVEDIGCLLADESALPTSVFSLNPSFHVLPTDHPVVSLWAAHQSDDPSPTLADIALDRKETALVFRNGLDVLIMEIDAAAGTFLSLLKQELPIGLALEQTPGDVDLPGVLGLLIQQQLIVGISTLEPRP